MSACGQYETDLTDEQWEVLHPLLPVRQWRPGGPGRPPATLCAKPSPGVVADSKERRRGHCQDMPELVESF